MPNRRTSPVRRRRSTPLAVTAMLVAAAVAAGCSAGHEAAMAPIDFAALGLRNGAAAPTTGVFCSGQPTPDQFAHLPAAGIRRVLCLRSKDEDGTGWEEARAAELGIEFVRWPVLGAESYSEESARRFAAELGSERPVLVACGSSHRVGVMMALKARFVDGLAPEQAIQLGQRCGWKRPEPAATALLQR